jgi:hypothetical protein
MPFMTDQQKSSLPLERIDLMISCPEEEMMTSNLKTIHLSELQTKKPIPKKRNVKEVISAYHNFASNLKTKEVKLKTKKPKTLHLIN